MLSQRTVGKFQHLLDVLFYQQPIDGRRFAPPLLSHSYYRRLLYESDSPDELLEHIERRYGWEPTKFLPPLYDGRIVAFLKDYPTPMKEHAKFGERFLNVFIEVAFTFVHSLPIEDPEAGEAMGQVVASLQADGFDYVHEKIVPATALAMDLAKEVDALTQLILQCRLPSESVILHHYSEATELFTTSKSELSLGEFRKFLEQILRDIAETSAPHRPDVTKSTGTMKDVLDYLHELGFFDKDERTGSYGAVYGFFSAGTKPGILSDEHAKAAMVLSLTFGRLLLTKYAQWKINWRHFA